MPDQNPVQRILLVRLSAIGDIVMASGFLTALRLAYPRARISWLTQPECAALLSTNPDLDEVISWPRKHWQELWQRRAFWALRQEMKSFQHLLHQREFDLAIDLQGLLKSGWLCYLSGARRRIGLGSREGSSLFMHQVLDRSAADQPDIGSEYRSALQQMGLDPHRYRLKLGIAKSLSHELLARLPADAGIDLILCPFTTRPQKHWRQEHWLELCRQLSAQGRHMLVLGGPADRGASEPFTDLPGVINLTGRTSLPEAASLIASARSLVGVDTGLTHMGHAFGIPTLCLFGSTRPYLNTDNSRGRVIYLNKTCAPCRRHPTCGGSFHCMGDISPAMVMATLKQIEGLPA